MAIGLDINAPEPAPEPASTVDSPPSLDVEGDAGTRGTPAAATDTPAEDADASVTHREDEGPIRISGQLLRAGQRLPIKGHGARDRPARREARRG